MRVLWQVEIDPFCQAVLAKHWPDVPRFGDVRSVGADVLAPVDVLAGGFPCQPVSQAGLRRAQRDTRWLWPEFARLVRELRPRYVLVENVPGLLARGRGMGDVLGELAAAGYDAPWASVRASDVGAPHERLRVFIVAVQGSVPDSVVDGVRLERQRNGEQPGLARPRVAESTGKALRDALGRGARSLADAEELAERAGLREGGPTGERRGRSRDGDSARAEGLAQSLLGRVFDGLPDRVDGCWPAGPSEAQHEWEPPRVAYRVPARTARLRAIGNAVVPQVAEYVGRCIVALEEAE